MLHVKRLLPLSIIGFLLVASNFVLAQRIVNVDPGFETLNKAIDEDTTATGERVDLNTVYVLERGGLYLLNGTIENRFPLKIHAAEGEGARPILQPAVVSGGVSDLPFTPRDDLEIKGLYVTGEDELGGLNSRIIRVRGDSARIAIDDCHLDKSSQAGFRIDTDWTRLILTNTIISNIGETVSPNNGRGIDDRGNDIDSLVVENCTWYNLTSRAVRDDGGVINYARFNHNTFVNLGQRVVTFGPTNTAIFTNNMVVNGGYYGNKMLVEEELANVVIDPGDAVEQVRDIRNNNFYFDPALAGAFPDTVAAMPNFGATAQAAINTAGAGSTILAEAITFTNGPAAPTEVMTSWYTNPGAEIQPDLDTSGEPFDFSYPTSSASYTGATSNQPIGSLVWFDMEIIPTPPFVPEPRYVQVDPGFETLNKAIDEDTTATGERVDLNTVYVLERGGLYLLNGTIENRFPLKIHAAEGEGARPILQPAVVSGGVSDLPFTPRDDLEIKGLYVTGEDELGGLNSRIIRVRGDSARIAIDDCHLDKSSQAGFRIDTDWTRLILTNTIISNIGETVSPNNGRGIDDRGNDIDSLVVENCTWYNLTSRAVRDDGGVINYARFNHNTFVNLGQRVVTFGPTNTAIFTNNMVVNGGYYGNKMLVEEELANVVIDPGDAVEQVRDIRNNNFYFDPALAGAFPDTVAAMPNFGATAQAAINAAGAGSTILAEAITFTNGPAAPTEVMTSWYTNPGAEIQPDLDTSGEPFDFSYATTTASYTGSTAGQPLGSLVWFDMDIITSVENQNPFDSVTDLPSTYNLVGNYPNPFNPTTEIVYNVAQPGNVRLTVYNYLGQKVATLVDKHQASGSYQVTWNGLDDSGRQMSSGLYFYRFEANNFQQTKKMILMK